MTVRLSREKVRARGSGTPPPSVGDGFHVSEIRLQTDFGLRAYGEIRSRVDVGNDDLASFAFAQLLLGAAANVSKLLFPTSKAKKSVERGGRLRGALKVTDDSLVASRKARNYVEHFDERLDKYLFKRPGVLLRRLIVPQWEPEITVDDGRRLPASCLQVLEMSSRTLILLDDRFSLGDLASELDRIREAADRFLTTRESASP